MKSPESPSMNPGHGDSSAKRAAETLPVTIESLKRRENRFDEEKAELTVTALEHLQMREDDLEDLNEALIVTHRSNISLEELGGYTQWQGDVREMVSAIEFGRLPGYRLQQEKHWIGFHHEPAGPGDPGSYRVYARPPMERAVPLFQAMMADLSKNPGLRSAGFSAKMKNPLVRKEAYRHRDRVVMYFGESGIDAALPILLRFAERQPEAFRESACIFGQPMESAVVGKLPGLSVASGDIPFHLQQANIIARALGQIVGQEDVRFRGYLDQARGSAVHAIALMLREGDHAFRSWLKKRLIDTYPAKAEHPEDAYWPALSAANIAFEKPC